MHELVLTAQGVLGRLLFSGNPDEFLDLILHPTLKDFNLLQDQPIFDHVVNQVASLISSCGPRRRRKRCVWRTTVNQRMSEPAMSDQQSRRLEVRKHEMVLQR